jgi:NSS family neurotransmitter:Na+ symporter
MADTMSERREFWSSGMGFTLATIGSAIGLGSIWKFPYEVGTNGGGMFVLFYVLGLALVVFPLLLTEIAVGRRGASTRSAASPR